MPAAKDHAALRGLGRANGTGQRKAWGVLTDVGGACVADTSRRAEPGSPYSTFQAQQYLW